MNKEVSDDKFVHNKVLGMHWNPRTCMISSKINLRRMPDTKRGLWATIAQVFNPLGICAPYLLPGTRLLQEICAVVKEWDSPILHDLLKKWQRWLTGLPCLERLEIPRCYCADEVNTYELHTFCDSSESGLGSVSYLRMISDKGVHVAFVMGKDKVVPRRTTLTIPKLELIAAALGAKMHWQIKHSIKLKLAECYLYTDSTVVMDWLRNTNGRLKKWVARKITEINRHSDIDSWLKVPTIHNAADVCSRGADPRKADPKSVYLNAPAFLHETESHIALYELNAKAQCSTVETSCSNTCTTAIDCDSDLSNDVEFYCRHDVDIADNDAIVYDNKTAIELYFGRS